MTRPRRTHLWFASLIGLAFLVVLIQPAAGQAPAPSTVDLVALFPTSAQLPAGATLVDEGARTLTDIAATFPDPVDARHVLTTYGWTENAYRVYTMPAPVTNTPPGGPIRLEISLHRFVQGEPGPMHGCSACGAAFALPYFAHGRAVLLGQQEVIALESTPCDLQVLGPTGGAWEFTLYQRIGAVLARITVSQANSQWAYYTVVPLAGDMANALLEQAGTSPAAVRQTCQ
jgi:hypothetical protein